MTATTTTAPERQGDRRQAVGLPEAPTGRTTGWWGMMLFIGTESATFAALCASYFYLRFVGSGPWPPTADTVPSLPVPSISTGVLVVSCVPMAVAVRLAARRGGRVGAWLLLALTMLAGVAFVLLTLLDFRQEYPDSTLSKDAYGSLFYSITGLHALHVAVGVVMLLVVLASIGLRRIGAGDAGPVRIVAMYWYFLAVLAVVVYLTVYISPYL